jgi:hypothetical protein
MLSIIPKEVLATLGNIHKLLDIGQNFSKPAKSVNLNTSASSSSTANMTANTIKS